MYKIYYLLETKEAMDAQIKPDVLEHWTRVQELKASVTLHTKKPNTRGILLHKRLLICFLPKNISLLNAFHH
jgi:hypothetical protein